jgi:hypothetical protein
VRQRPSWPCREHRRSAPISRPCVPLRSARGACRCCPARNGFAPSRGDLHPPRAEAREGLSRGGRSLSYWGCGHVCRGVQHPASGCLKAAKALGLDAPPQGKTGPRGTLQKEGTHGQFVSIFPRSRWRNSHRIWPHCCRHIHRDHCHSAGARNERPNRSQIAQAAHRCSKPSAASVGGLVKAGGFRTCAVPGRCRANVRSKHWHAERSRGATP